MRYIIVSLLLVSLSGCVSREVKTVRRLEAVYKLGQMECYMKMLQLDSFNKNLLPNENRMGF